MKHLLTVNVSWEGENPFVKGRRYQLQRGNFVSCVEVLQIKQLDEHETGERLSVERLFAGEQAEVDLELEEDLAATAFDARLGDSCWLNEDGKKVGTFTVKHVLRRSTNVIWQETDVNRTIRAAQKNQRSKTFWFTGLSGSGKSILANEFEKNWLPQVFTRCF